MPANNDRNATENLLADLVLGNDDLGNESDSDDTGDLRNEQELEDKPAQRQTRQRNEPTDDDEDDDASQRRNDRDENDDEDDDLDPIARRARGRPRKDEQQRRGAKQKPKFDMFKQFKEDRQGNLVDDDGSIVVQRGRERERFEQFRKMATRERRAAMQMAGRLQQLGQGVQELMRRHKELEANKSMFEKAGLSFDDQRLMLDIATAYKKSPLEGIKLFLTKASAAGVDVKSLGVQGGVDATSLVTLLDQKISERLKPVTELTARNEDREKIAEEVNGFFVRNPAATNVAKALGQERFAQIMQNMKQQEPNKTLDEHFRTLHYELLSRQAMRPNDTAPSHRERTAPNRGERRTRMGNSSRREFTGHESFEDIGKSVLDDLNRG